MKLFWVLALILSLFLQPFMTQWPLDIEILARFTQTRQGASLKQGEDVVYKFPLYEWCGVASSKKAWNFLRVLC